MRTQDSLDIQTDAEAVPRELSEDVIDKLANLIVRLNGRIDELEADVRQLERDNRS